MEGRTYLEQIVEHLASRVCPPLEVGVGHGERFVSDRVGKVYDTAHHATDGGGVGAQRKCLYDFLGDGDDHAAPSARLDAQEVARALNQKATEKRTGRSHALQEQSV